MKIAVISDLHLGRGGRNDHFGHDDAEFLTFLDHLEGNFERIVLLGDIYETLTGARPGTQVRELAAARAAHPEICARFRRPAYQYVHGNHDIVTRHVDGAPDTYTIQANGTRVLFTHGHIIDWIVQRARWLSEFTVWLGGWVTRLGMSAVLKAVERVEWLMTGVGDEPGKGKFERLALDLASRSSADIIVTGHTHRPMKSESDGRLFLNSGSCHDGKLSWVSMDTARGDYALQTSF